jgi:plastocyanin
MPEEFEPQLTGEKRSFRTANEPGISWLLIIFFLILLALAVMIFGRDRQLAGPVPTATPEPSTSGQPRVYTILYDAGVFSPTNLRIHAGDTVRFKNESIFPIRIMSEDMAGFDSVGDIPQGSAFTLTFAERGTFTYFNSHNPDQTGAIIVR